MSKEQLPETLPELPLLHAVTPQLDEVLTFLYGAGDLDGAGFLEVPPGKPRYWWRTKLREALKVEAEAIARAAVRMESYVIDMLVAAGHVTQAKVDEARRLAAAIRDRRKVMEEGSCSSRDAAQPDSAHLAAPCSPKDCREGAPLGRCCYGGKKAKSACASCAAWTPAGGAP